VAAAMLGSTHFDGVVMAGSPAHHGVQMDSAMDGAMDGATDGAMDGAMDGAIDGERHRPTVAELNQARALIARVKMADSSIKKADERLVCAAIAFRGGEFDTPTASARAMGKEISRPKQVTDWVERLARVERLAKLAQIPERLAGGDFLVQPGWCVDHSTTIS
jgi:hypothetical protein